MTCDNAPEGSRAGTSGAAGAVGRSCRVNHPPV